MSLYGCVSAYLGRRLGDWNDTEDLTQIVLTKALEALRRGNGPAQAALKPWLLRIADNELCNHRKKQNRLTVVDPAELERRRELVEDAVEAPELGWLTHRRLIVQFERLSERERRVLEYRFRFELPHEVIADSVGYSTANTVHNAQRRALEKLESRLTDGGQRGQRAAFESSRLPSRRHRPRGGSISLLPRFSPRSALWAIAPRPF